ncbi:MAG TPA: CheR family methyltransferase [Myxococcales bacterium]|jgi:chemotaxis protein methyltransferase CheR
MAAHDERTAFLQEVLPRLGLRARGFRRVQGQVHKRIARRVQALGLDGLEAYRRHLDAHPEEWGVLDGLCRVTISRFFRDRAVFERLREHELPRLRDAARGQGRPLRCWSAGCASGEEPYTLALILRVGLGLPPGSHQIVASDADEALLARARHGRYESGSLKEIPADLKERGFRRDGPDFRIREEVAEGIEWRCEDLRRSMPEGPFDAILCRNLAFTYFGPELQRSTLARLGERLAVGGVLVLGAHEALPEGAGWRRAGTLPIFTPER